MTDIIDVGRVAALKMMKGIIPTTALNDPARPGYFVPLKGIAAIRRMDPQVRFARNGPGYPGLYTSSARGGGEP